MNFRYTDLSEDTAAIGKAIECAARDLPDRFYIEIRIDKDGSSVSLCSDPPLEIHDFPTNGESLVEQINDAVEFAIKNHEQMD
jgi:hypothetical protein